MARSYLTPWGATLVILFSGLTTGDALAQAGDDPGAETATDSDAQQAEATPANPEPEAPPPSAESETSANSTDVTEPAHEPGSTDGGTLQGIKEAEWIIEDGSVQDRPVRLALSAFILPVSLGLSLWTSIPIVHEGFIPDLNDSFDIELGGNFGYYWVDGGSHLAIVPMAGPRWNFHLTEAWSVFATVKGGFWIRLYDTRPDDVVFSFDGSLGAVWNITDLVGLRFEVGGWWGILRAGATIPF